MKRTDSIRLAALLSFCAALMAPSLSFSRSGDGATDKGASPIDPVAALADQLKAGGKPLVFTPSPLGYLPDLLRRLNVAEDSQLLVFSRSSFQAGFVGPASPRAIYFSDTISIAYIPGAPLVEFWAVGRDGRVRFYTLANKQGSVSDLPIEDRECDLCHAGNHPAAPGPTMLSVSTASNGNVRVWGPQTDARTPITTRWGGWYVTGLHGDMRHRGNVHDDSPSAVVNAAQNLNSLAGRFKFSQYSRPTSDIVALMTLNHESGFLNYANAIQAWATVKHDPTRMDEAVNELADYMLGVDHAVLTAPVKGVSGFAERFEAEGLKDGMGRSLRDFDLRTRLFRYPLSYMIYTPAFDGLPPEAKAKLYLRLAEVLTGRDRSAKYQSLSEADRTAAFDILSATKPDLPPCWRKDAAWPALPAIKGR
jgi:hypothetical protein